MEMKTKNSFAAHVFNKHGNEKRKNKWNSMKNGKLSDQI